jgi:hypothetical protein
MIVLAGGLLYLMYSELVVNGNAIHVQQDQVRVLESKLEREQSYLAAQQDDLKHKEEELRAYALEIQSRLDRIVKGEMPQRVQ